AYVVWNIINNYFYTFFIFNCGSVYLDDTFLKNFLVSSLRAEFGKIYFNCLIIIIGDKLMIDFTMSFQQLG
ncbi:protease modulator HflC, partial [Francisella tularensis subsp. holarctica]|nr:protease modulator HflC [Francisella tularensis subsp. holarctica]